MKFTWGFAVVVGSALLFPAMATADAVAPADVTITDGEVASSLTGTSGDPKAGREWFVTRSLGNCLACHGVEKLKDEPFHGEVGPVLDGVADRYTEAQLRAIVVNPKTVFGEQTVMPAFYKADGFVRLRKDFEGKTIMSAQQVEDVVAFLTTLKE